LSEGGKFLPNETIEKLASYKFADYFEWNVM
jgi:hypothetical protein